MLEILLASIISASILFLALLVVVILIVSVVHWKTPLATLIIFFMYYHEIKVHMRVVWALLIVSIFINIWSL